MIQKIMTPSSHEEGKLAQTIEKQTARIPRTSPNYLHLVSRSIRNFQGLSAVG